VTITLDAAATETTGTANPTSYSHAGGASPQGVVVCIVHGTVSTDLVTGVTYGGTAMTRRQTNVDSATEAGRSYIYTLGASVPTGTQTVSVARSEATTTIHVVTMSLDAAGNLFFVDSDGIDGNQANPVVTLQYGGRSCMGFGALYWGGAVPPGATGIGAECTAVHDFDFTAFISQMLRQTTAGTSDFTIGYTALATDDVAYSAVALSDEPAVFTSTASLDGVATIEASGVVVAGGVERAASLDAVATIAASGTVTPAGGNPRQVQNLQATAISDTQINLTWDVPALPLPAVYDIERDGVVIEEDRPDNSFSDTGLTSNTLYTYRVRAVDGYDLFIDTYVDVF
jgi:hypothetical protein